MKINFFAALLICVCSLNIFAQSKITKEEYAVYASVLKIIYADNLEENKTKLSFVIIDTTQQPDNPIGIRKVNKIRGLINNFRQRNKESVKLEKSFPIKYRYEMVNKSEIDRLLESEKRKDTLSEDAAEGWKTFERKYPDSNGYYQFSRIGFSSGREFALIHIKRSAAHGGNQTNYVLRKKKGLWTLYLAYGGGWVA